MFDRMLTLLESRLNKALRSTETGDAGFGTRPDPDELNRQLSKRA